MNRKLRMPLHLILRCLERYIRAARLDAELNAYQGTAHFDVEVLTEVYEIFSDMEERE